MDVQPELSPGLGQQGRTGGAPRRIATISVHTSPLDQPGTGDAGGLNVYVVEVARQLAQRGVEVEIFTRAVCRETPPVVELAPGVLVRSMVAGPFEELDKNSLPGQICPFTFGVLRTEADFAPGRYDLVHAHYWLSGQVGAVAASRWRVPLVQSMHTLGKVKNLALASGDCAEPAVRIRGEGEVVAAADRLVANTSDEARQLIELYGATPWRVETVSPPRLVKLTWKHARAKTADLQTEVARQNLAQMRNTIARDVRTTWQDTNRAYERLSVTRQLREQADLALDLAQQRYNLGLGSIVEFTQAELGKTEADIADTDATYQYRLTQIVLAYTIAAPK